MNGLLVVDKPGANDAPADRLWTSHDVVQRVRRLSGERRIGHTGTLDPMASGVLVLCLGPSTRLVEYLQGHPKRYLAEIHFGAATDTYDATGAIVEQKPVPDLQSEDVARVLEDFRGEQMQQPPAFSAIKQDGERLYRKARRGDKVEARPRPITVHELILVDWSAPDRLLLDVTCSAGTYIRSLAHDLGHALATAAHLSALRRTAAGPLHIQDAHTLGAIEDAADDETFADLVLAPNTALDFPRLHVDATEAQRLGYGQHVPIVTRDDIKWATNTLAQAVDEHDQFLGIVRCTDALVDAQIQTFVWKAEKWFPPC